MKFHHFCLHLEKSFWLPLEKSIIALAPSQKKPFRRPWSRGLWVSAGYLQQGSDDGQWMSWYCHSAKTTNDLF